MNPRRKYFDKTRIGSAAWCYPPSQHWVDKAGGSLSNCMRSVEPRLPVSLMAAALAHGWPLLLCSVFFSAIGEIIAEDGRSCFPAWHRKASQGSGNSSLIYLVSTLCCCYFSPAVIWKLLDTVSDSCHLQHLKPNKTKIPAEVSLGFSAPVAHRPPEGTAGCILLPHKPHQSHSSPTAQLLPLSLQSFTVRGLFLT